jgi:hypothetical protein
MQKSRKDHKIDFNGGPRERDNSITMIPINVRSWELELNTSHL